MRGYICAQCKRWVIRAYEPAALQSPFMFFCSVPCGSAWQVANREPSYGPYAGRVIFLYDPRETAA